MAKRGPKKGSKRKGRGRKPKLSPARVRKARKAVKAIARNAETALHALSKKGKKK